MTDKNPIRAFPAGAAPGMTLRDYFATKAMQGLIAANPAPREQMTAIVDLAYEYADQMMAARNKDPIP